MIGGSYQKGNWDTTPDPNMTQRILKRAIEVCPQLVKPGQGVEGLDIVRVYAALRPLRIGGARLEKEEIGGVTVVHNYGAGGFGCGFSLRSPSLSRGALTRPSPSKLRDGRVHSKTCG